MEQKHEGLAFWAVSTRLVRTMECVRVDGVLEPALIVNIILDKPKSFVGSGD